MRYVDAKHVMWWASNAEGCDTIIDSSTGAPYCSKCDQSNAECAKVWFTKWPQCHPKLTKTVKRSRSERWIRVKNSVKAKYGVSSSTLDLNNSVHRQMSAKLIWQHYRQALEKEYNVSQIIWTIWYRPYNIICKNQISSLSTITNALIGTFLSHSVMTIQIQFLVAMDTLGKISHGKR